jgi:MSHA pilin protein MshD
MFIDSRRARAFTLIELIFFILVVSIALAAVLMAISTGVMHSSDPMVRKQAMAAAESLLEEIELQPFTYCDPNDASATTATGAAGCSSASNSMDNPANWGVGKTRYGPTFFDNVADYNNFTMSGTLNDFLQQSSTRLSGYSAAVAIAQVGTGFGLPNGNVLRVTVTVTGSGDTITLTGFRFRHSPNITN